MRQTFIPSGDDVGYDLLATKNKSVCYEYISRIAVGQAAPN